MVAGEQVGGMAGSRTPLRVPAPVDFRCARVDSIRGFPHGGSRKSPIPAVLHAVTLPGMVPRSLMLRLTRETEQDVSRTVVYERYWLAHSDGFRVDGPAGRLGTVLRVIDGDQTLVIRTGILGNHTLLARYDQVERLEPWHEWLSLVEVPTTAGTPT